MTSRTAIETAILEQLAAKAALPEFTDPYAFNYVDTGVVDSLGVMSLVVGLEDAFDMELTDEAIMSDAFRTLGGLTDIVAAALGGSSDAIAS